eukprot:3087706-Amphidinium_carterae.1
MNPESKSLPNDVKDQECSKQEVSSCLPLSIKENHKEDHLSRGLTPTDRMASIDILALRVQSSAPQIGLIAVVV